MKQITVKIEEIHVGTRFRLELGDLSDLVEAIQDKGFVVPIIIDQKKNLLAGERRLEAARICGLKVLPAIMRDVEGEVDAREIELIENAARRDFTWQERAALEKHIMDLKKGNDPEWGIEKQSEYLKQSVGATQRRLALAQVMEHIPEIADCSSQEEAWKKFQKLKEEVVVASMRDKDSKEYKDAIKHAQDHYKIGDARVGLKKVNDGTVHFCEVDPPYAVNLKKAKGRVRSIALLDRYNEVEAKDYPGFIEEVATECFRVLRADSFMIWWFGPGWYAEVLACLRGVGFSVGEIPALWVKGFSAGQTASPDTMLGSAYEPFFVARKGKPILAKPGRSNVFHFDPVPPQAKIHPTERPVELMEELLDTFCYPGFRACVPFLGSGVTLRALYRKGSVGFGWELDEMCKERFLNAVYSDQLKNEGEQG